MGSPQLSNQSINGASRVYGIIGFPVEHSLSPNFWNGAFCALGMNAVYVPFHVNDEMHLGQAITGLQKLGICGINVTAPYKEKVATLCNVLHYPADEIGVVNTIKFSTDTIEGWNTDATALLNLLKQQKKFKTVTILGNGSVARSAIWALSKLNIERLYVIARSDKTNFSIFANKLLPQSFQHILWNKENILKHTSISDLVINATSLKDGDNTQVSGLKASLKNHSVYVNFTYANQGSQDETKKARYHCISGKDLLMQQGIESFQILSGTKVTEKIIRKFIFTE